MMNYGRMAGGVLEYAPKTLGLVANPTPAQYRTAGWKPVFANAPAPRNAPAGFHFERNGWLEQANGILPKWRLAKDAPPPAAVVQSDGVYHLVDAATGDYARVDVVYDAEQGKYVTDVVGGLVKRSDGTIGEEEEEEGGSDDS